MDRRSTLQRELVLSAVKELQCHATADQVYSLIASRCPSVSRATVYRNLNILSEEGAILRVRVPGEAEHYDHTTGAHVHAFCEKCKRVFDVDTLPLGDLKEALTDTKGMRVTGYDLVFRGVCGECERAAAQSTAKAPQYENDNGGNVK